MGKDKVKSCSSGLKVKGKQMFVLFIAILITASFTSIATITLQDPTGSTSGIMGDTSGAILSTNGSKTWTLTEANLQTAIYDADNASTTITVTGDLSLSSGITGAENVTLDFLEHTITPTSSFDIITMKPGFKLKNMRVDVTTGVIDFTDNVIFFDGADTYEVNDVQTSVKNVYVESHDKQGTLIEMRADAGSKFVTMVDVVDVKGISMEYLIHINVTNNGGGTAWVNGNIFERCIGRTVKHFIYMDKTGAGNQQIDMNMFTNFIAQYGSAGEEIIYCEGNWNYFSGYNSDYNAGVEVGLLDLSGSNNWVYTNVIYGTCSFDNVSNTGTDNNVIDLVSNYMDWEKHYDADKMHFLAGTYLDLTGGTAIRLQKAADAYVAVYSSCGTGENQPFYIYGRNSGDTASEYLNLQWGGGSNDGYIQTSSGGGGLRLEPDNNIVSIYDVLYLSPRSTKPTEAEGIIYANSTTNMLEYYDGSNWYSLNMTLLP